LGLETVLHETGPITVGLAATLGFALAVTDCAGSPEKTAD
jgi:transketolase